MSVHYPLCGLPDWAPIGDRECDCAIIDTVRAQVLDAWQIEGRAVLFNRAGHDFGPQQRVATWLREVLR